ncbi:MAG: uroporphyrinogen decarboxylase family protein [bacterium]|nr:uroporphyrinogen decarboxylase family protein [bacterium]
MNKRERVLAAMNLQKTDRPPVGFWFHFPQEKALGEACVQAHLDYYNTIDVDMVKIMCDGYFDYPNPVAKAVREPEDWFAMKPLGREHPFITEQVERAKAVKAGLRDDMVVIYNVFAPFSLIRFGVGDDLVMAHLRQCPEAIAYALNVIAQDCCSLAELLVTQAGLDGIYYCVQGGEKNRFTAAYYREHITPSDLAVLEHANRFSDTNVLHCCGWAGIPNHMEVWQDYPARVVNWACHIERMDLPAGKRFFGARCILGGFDNRIQGVLYAGTREEVEAETRRLIAMTGGQGVILGADCTLPATVDVQRFQWVVETTEQATEC